MVGVAAMKFVVCWDNRFAFLHQNHCDGTETSLNKSRYFLPWDDKLPEVGVVKVTWPSFKFWAFIFGMGKARRFTFDMQIDRGQY